MKTIKDLSPPLNPILITTEKDALLACADIKRMAAAGPFGHDTETNVVQTFHDRKIRTLQFGDRDKQYIFDLLQIAGSTQALMEQGWKKMPSWFANIANELAPIMESSDAIKVGYYLQFEAEMWLWSFGIRLRGLWDSSLAERLLLAGTVFPKASGYFAADDIIKKYTGYEIDKTLQTSFDLESMLTDEQLPYAAADVRFPMATRAGQLKKLEANGMLTVMDIENKAIPWFAEAKINGFYCDHPKWFGLCDAAEAQHKRNVAELDKIMVAKLGEAKAPDVDLAGLEKLWKDEKDKEFRKQYRQDFQEAKRQVKAYNDAVQTYEGLAPVNYASSTQLLEILKNDFGYKLTDTNDRTLSKLKGPVIDALQNYRQTAKLMSTYNRNFLDKALSPYTGRVHSTLNQVGAATGRTSSNDPNLQNIPKFNKKDPNTFDWRSAFCAQDETRTLVIADYDGCELRIMAELSGEQVWIDAFNKGQDVHSISAEMILGDEWLDAAEPGCAYIESKQKCNCTMHKIMRDWIKAVNFGIAYGMAEGKLSDSIGKPKEHCRELLSKWHKALKFVSAMLAKSGEAGKMLGKAVTIAGRIRWFPKPMWDKAKELAEEDAKKSGKPMFNNMISRKLAMMFGSIEREAKNTPIQGTNADIAKRAMQYLSDSKLTSMGWLPVMFVHDEFVYEGPKATAEEAKAIIEECMMRAGADFVKRIKMPAGGKISDVWEK